MEYMLFHMVCFYFIEGLAYKSENDWYYCKRT